MIPVNKKLQFLRFFKKNNKKLNSQCLNHFVSMFNTNCIKKTPSCNKLRWKAPSHASSSQKISAQRCLHLHLDAISRLKQTYFFFFISFIDNSKTFRKFSAVFSPSKFYFLKNIIFAWKTARKCFISWIFDLSFIRLLMCMQINVFISEAEKRWKIFDLRGNVNLLSKEF